MSPPPPPSSFDRLAVLAHASEVLASSLDFETTLGNVLGLALPQLGDFGFFDVVEDGGDVRRTAGAHEDPRRLAILAQSRWQRSERRDVNLCALSSGEVALHPAIDDAWLRDVAVSDGHLAVMRTLDFCSMLSVPLRYQGRLLGALTLFRAAGARPHAPADVELAQELARRAAAAVQNALLYREARAAVQVREDFLSVASHELRTPLTSLQLHVDGLRRAAAASVAPDAPPDALRGERLLQRLERVAAQTQRLSALVDELLDVSRLSGGRLVLTRTPVELGALVRDVVARFAEQAADAGCALHLTVHGAAHGRWDAARLEQVVTNLLSNALKYGAGAPVDVEVGALAGGDTAPHGARLAVRDRGVGVAPADQERIFQKFERAASPRNFAGLGLGLWIAREVVRAHGGHIGVRSSPGAGATFEVLLPTTPGADSST